MTHHTLITKRDFNLFGRPVKIEIQVFPALNVVPGPLDSRLVQHLFYVTKIRMASLDELDRPSPIEDFIKTVAQVVMPKKEFRAGSGTGGSGATPDGGDAGATPDGGDAGATPDGDGATPDGDGATPDGDGATPPGDGATPPGDGATPPGDGATPPGDGNGINTNKDGSRQGKDDGKTPEQRAADAKKRAKEAGSDDNMKAFAALGIVLAVATALIATSLANFLASDGAKIKFTRIVTERAAPGFVPNFLTPTPTKVSVTWTVQSVGHPGGIASNIRVLKTDDIEWHDSKVGTLDGTSPSPTKIKGDREFVVESGLEDSSEIDVSNTGYGIIHTSFDDQLDAAVQDAASGIGDLAGSLFEGLTGLGIGTILMIVFAVIILFIGAPIIFDIIKSSFSSSSAKNNS